MAKINLAELREEMRAVARGERSASALPASSQVDRDVGVNSRRELLSIRVNALLNENGEPTLTADEIARLLPTTVRSVSIETEALDIIGRLRQQKLMDATWPVGPLSAQEIRVVERIEEHGGLGATPDPIGFVLASLNYSSFEIAEERRRKLLLIGLLREWLDRSQFSSDHQANGLGEDAEDTLFARTRTTLDSFEGLG